MEAPTPEELTAGGIVQFDSLDAEANPKAAEWFKQYPKVEDALALDDEKKSEFISKYYPVEENFDEYLEKLSDQSEKTVEKEIAEGHTKMPFSENLVVGLINIAKVNVIEELVAKVATLTNQRRETVKGKPIEDPVQAMCTQEYMQGMGMVIEESLVKQLEAEAKSRNLELNSFMGISVSYLMGDISILIDLEKIFQLSKVQNIDKEECDLTKLEAYIRSSMQLS